MHPVAVLAVNALTTNFHFYLCNHLLAWEVKPTSVDTSQVHVGIGATGNGGICRTFVVTHVLVDFWESNLEVSAVCKIAVACEGACHAATESRPVR